MALLELIIVVVLLFEVGSDQERIHRFHRPGQDATLPCGTHSSNRPSSCSNIEWLYNGAETGTSTVARNRNVDERSPRAARLSVDTDCSLVIKRITAEDVGRYTCRLNNDVNHDALVNLNLLTISLIPADADPRRGDEVTLECSLLRYRGFPACQQNGLRWVDETGTVLSEGVVKLSRQADCVSNLTVKRQSGNDRTYTCQFVNKDNKEEIQAAYTPVFTDPPSDPDPNADHQNFILIGAVIGVVVLLVVFAAVLIKYRKKAKVTEDAQKLAQQHDEPESNLTYVTVSHKTQQESPKGRAKKEEDVTYSTVKSPVKIDDDPSSLYSNVSKPR